MKLLNDLIFKNFTIKIVSLLFALILWSLVIGQEKSEVGFIIPVQLQNIPISIVVDSGALDFVHVRVKGPKGIISKLSTQQFDAQIDLSNTKPGENIISLLPQHIKKPQGVEVIRISPSYIKVYLKVRKLAKIKPVTIGKLPVGFELKNISTIPQRIEIIGEEKDIEKVKEISTEPIDISKITENVVKKITLKPLKGDIQILITEDIKARIEVAEKIIEKEIKKIPVLPRKIKNVQIKPAYVNIKIKGPLNTLSKLKKEEIIVDINLDNLEPGKHTQPVKIILPPKVELISANPESLQINILKTK